MGDAGYFSHDDDDDEDDDDEDDDDEDDGDENDELFLWNLERQKTFTPYFQTGPLLEIFTIASLWYAASNI